MPGLDIASMGANVGITAANDLMSTGLGLLLEQHNDQRQLNQQQALDNMQLNANESMADYNQKLQMQMWNATNYPAQVEQLEKAGLNPALLYAKGGTGGTTGAATGGPISGAQAPSGGHEIMDIQHTNQMMMGLQMQQMQAQIDQTKAQTELAQAQAAKTSGVDTDVAKANVEQIGATTGNVKADTILKQLQQGLLNIQTSIAQNTKGDVEGMIWANGQKAISEANSAAAQANVDGATIQPRIDMATQQVINMGIQAEAQKAGIQLTQAQTQAATESATQMYNNIKQNWKSLNQKDQQIQIEQYRTKLMERGLNQQLAGQIIQGVATMATY